MAPQGEGPSARSGQLSPSGGGGAPANTFGLPGAWAWASCGDPAQNASQSGETHDVGFAPRPWET